jgi:hypothetical protein
VADTLGGYKADDAGTIKDIALLVLAAVAGLAPGLLDKLGIDVPHGRILN